MAHDPVGGRDRLPDLRLPRVSGNVSEDNPLYGLFRFKQGFGGAFTEFVGEEDLVLSPFIYWAVEHGTSVFKDLRKTVYLIKNRGKK